MADLLESVYDGTAKFLNWSGKKVRTGLSYLPKKVKGAAIILLAGGTLLYGHQKDNSKKDLSAVCKNYCSKTLTGQEVVDYAKRYLGAE